MYLRQSTASQEILLGPFLDSTDGDTPETGLTIANTDILLWMEGGTTTPAKHSGGATHVSGDTAGLYTAVLDATDTATLGKLEVNVHVAGALAVRREFTVLPARLYDGLILGVSTPLTVPPADTADYGSILQWIFQQAFFQRVTNTVKSDVTDDAGTVIGRAPISVDNTDPTNPVVTRAKYQAPA